MFEKLEALLKRARELEGLLADSQVISDKTKYQKYAKELSSILPMVNRYKEYKEASAEIMKVENLLSKKGEDKEFMELAREELAELKEKKDNCQHELEEHLLEEGADRARAAIVEIRAGTGGLEASLFAADLYRMYTKYAAKKSWRVESITSAPTEAGGFKEIIFSVQGEGAYRYFQYESGVHRVQRVPATETGGRIHTSAATVAVLPEAEEVEVVINPKDLKIDVFRSSGPGGQSVNTADSAVRITHIPTGIVTTCQDERSQLKNKIKAMRVLRARLLDKLKTEQESKISETRRAQILTGDRSQKIRTYNFPDRRITDHRIGFTSHNLDRILEGDLEELISALMKADREERLKNQ